MNIRQINLTNTNMNFSSADYGHLSSPPFRQRGVGLVEVLVALLLLSIALLGMARLQLETMQDQRLSYNRTVAHLLAQEMAERIQANADAVDNYSVSNLKSRELSGGCSKECTSEDLASQDLDDWQENLQDSTLTDADADIAVDDSEVTLTLRWQDARSGEAREEVFIFEVLE
ncbi:MULTISPECIES: type IV pilus modification protein PilV [unclassified Halomonas]|uniref:type IV pilus modification protein PilV n=1 Tax=unclassified Halomonas TaxID=2609666 RepID=UPI0028884F27|nr:MULTISPECIES: type IV pilus modification protein PilV [unclassified Halomonas]MDT0501737.1 type IV pilus modification protein PilV [Halomonas sp. PAR7]MDT0513433.1 type IV pilus modification protein PilV [Halomonas sp. LES1]MDT0591800.1 type IV pilus modification protein PilV [Halomonas sp. PAR8]